MEARGPSTDPQLQLALHIPHVLHWRLGLQALGLEGKEGAILKRGAFHMASELLLPRIQAVETALPLGTLSGACIHRLGVLARKWPSPGQQPARLTL